MNYDNHYDLAYYYLTQREFDKALHEYNTARQLNRNDVLLLLEIAEMHCYLGEHERATELVEEAMSLNPFYPEHYAVSLAWIQYFMPDYERTLELLSGVRQRSTDVLKLTAAANAQLAARDRANGDLESAARAQAVAGECLTSFLRLRPDWSVLKESRLATFRKAEDERHWCEGLRAAGLGEE